MSTTKPFVFQKEAEREHLAATRSAAQNSARRDEPDPLPLSALAMLPRRLWQAGNAAIGRWLGRQKGGHPLSPQTRRAMEKAFGTDFSHVRLHRDPAAQAAARELAADALTHGEHIYLSAEAPAFESPAGKALVAHELAHVVQQRRAGAVETERVSQAGDQCEHAAEAAAQQVMQGQTVQLPTSGAPPAIQRQRRQGVSRAQVQAALTAFLEQVRAAQGGQSLRVTPEVRLAVERIFSGDVGGLLAIQAWLQGTIFPGDPAEFAAQVVRRLQTETIDPARIAHLNAPTASETPSRFARVRGLVEQTAPSEPPPAIQESIWRFEQEAKNLRREEGAVGPFGLDVLRAGRILGGLPGALRTPAAPQPEARVYPAVEQAVQQIAANALVPAGVSGQAAESYADAREVARDLARRLDIAQQQGHSEIDLRLGVNYASVRDRGAIYSELQRIALLIREALPHHAASVTHINVYIGDRLVTRIALGMSRSE